jgi:low temperature requirement protein LtrA
VLSYIIYSAFENEVLLFRIVYSSIMARICLTSQRRIRKDGKKPDHCTLIAMSVCLSAMMYFEPTVRFSTPK